MEDKYITGIKQVVKTAQAFLNEFKEFAPFGLIFKNNEWIDLGAYDENLTSDQMKNFLISTIIEDFNEGNTEFGAVCVDAKIKEIGDVIIIYNTSNGKDWFELVYKYYLEGKSVKIIEENIEY
ncbi:MULTISPECIES: hypothetical protein [Chryseobacterium group]|jgi:hypothetical protein|uniref:Uncharacterized protein n=3 Tax=Chryseobacterium TaxID=59732 RepID=A0AAJ1R3K4_9FLAO|nr:MULTISPECIES: hypothetical protein [Chryseobacterium group]OJX29529.1 MAG: hypothetical protein BGO86_14275 [Chryseobacterium sp. 36-9]EFK33215.1 hypothetical protein HMPREF0204_12283 [Chryseobacterium gleum ATCC 35910]MDN4013305.1 hypothetical protein [Chryseobacterium gambrini]MDN4028841.1 hypothetical protein [Chryseobacterium gambrini]QQY34022.1 hypothetical protein I6I60_09765 [Chryseobacterium gleum]